MAAIILMHPEKYLRGIKDHVTYKSLKWITVFIYLNIFGGGSVKKTKFEPTELGSLLVNRNA